MEESDSQVSALRENIERKGHNSYYYAHGNTACGPQWDGKEEPRRLDGSEFVDPALFNSPKLTISTITEYYWADGTSNVKIYIDVDKADEIDDSDIHIQSNEASFEFKFFRNGKHNSLAIPNLHDSIESASFKKKPDKFILTLKKVNPTSWFQLKKT